MGFVLGVWGDDGARFWVDSEFGRAEAREYFGWRVWSAVWGVRGFGMGLRWRCLSGEAGEIFGWLGVGIWVLNDSDGGLLRVVLTFLI